MFPSAQASLWWYANNTNTIIGALQTPTNKSSRRVHINSNVIEFNMFLKKKWHWTFKGQHPSCQILPRSIGERVYLMKDISRVSNVVTRFEESPNSLHPFFLQQSLNWYESDSCGRKLQRVVEAPLSPDWIDSNRYGQVKYSSCTSPYQKLRIRINSIDNTAPKNALWLEHKGIRQNRQHNGHNLF